MTFAHVLVVGGGTVGHLAPGFAVADALRARDLTVRFATPGEARETEWFPASEPAPRRSPALRRPASLAGLPIFVLRYASAVIRAGALLGSVRPRMLVALGGWPCVPAVLAALVRRVPVAFISSDAAPGAAVRLLAPFARRIYVACESAAEALGRRPSVRVTGPAIRASVVEARSDPEHFGLAPDLPTLLVTGGSLGARALNEAVPQGVAAAVREEPTLAGRFQVLHQVGGSGEGVSQIYAAAGVPHRTVSFIRDMGAAYRTADLVVARAGALTCAELAAVGRPAVLVPYPHHADRQQYDNAQALSAAGGAVVLEEKDLTPDAVRDRVLALLLDDARREEMSAATCVSFVGGAARIAADLETQCRTGAPS